MFYVYILSSGRNGTLYTGQHRALGCGGHDKWLHPGFTSRYGMKARVWYEAHETREGAFVRERRIKTRDWLWKLELIEKANPGWRDLKSGFV